jgi:glycosyltransferase involved in cell wall biosynthesis
MVSIRRKLISVVSPCFNEEDNVRNCYEQVRQVFQEQLPDYDYEHVFCDNYSSDRTAEILAELAKADSRVKVILNARNFGPIHSNYNGILAARGDAVILCMPADVQDPPEMIPEFVAKWAEGNQVVYGRKAKREEGFVMRMLRAIHYRLSAKCSFVEIPVDVGLYQLVDKAIVDAMRASDDHFPYIQGLVAHAGFKRAFVDYTWRRRERNKSKATWTGLIDQGLNGLTAFSRAPLRATLYAGLWFMFAAIALGVVGIAGDVAWNRQLDLPVVPSLLLGMLFFSGVQLFSLGLMGEYVAAIHFQVRKRPMVVERGRLNFEESTSESSTPPISSAVPRPHFAINVLQEEIRNY